ncbi:malate dehydrogenase, mitochondrial [Dendroctonus ponderosae]|nr:malate dehydrogenase, mitochondrial [Dendroctonus ponderosae]KAH1015507.1 hypothetical protein HUJ05_013220 [Dendroctonus ponderosae]
MFVYKMCSRIARVSYIARRLLSETKTKKHTVAVIGAAGGIGQPLSLLLKLNPGIGELRLHDIVNIPGVAMDLSHIETASKVTHFTEKSSCAALKGGVDIIIVVAGLPRKPGMQRSDLFKANAQIIFDIAKNMAELSPEAILLIVTNPVNSVIPIACEVLKDAGKLCARRVIGVSTLDSVRAATFIAELTCCDPRDVTVPIIGGHSGNTILPLISKANPKVSIEGEKLMKLIKRIQQGGTEVVEAKAGKGSATLSTAYATSRLVFAILRAFGGESNIVECAYVKSDVHPELNYLATPLILGQNGVEKNLGIGKMSECEQKLFCELIPNLKKDIEDGEKFAKEALCNTKCEK